MKNSFNKVLSLVLALMMIVSCFSVITVSAADCKHNPETDKVVKTVAATCAENGSITYECATCKETYIKVLLATPETHTGLTEVAATPATCTDPAYGAGIYCKDCMAKKDGSADWDKVRAAVAAGDKAVKAPVAITGSPALGHDFVQYTIESTGCTEPTISGFACSRCELTVEEIIEDGGDSTLLTKYPTVTLVAAKDHEFKAEVVVKGTTCVDAVTKLTCKNCGYSKEVTTAAPHDWDDIKNLPGACNQYKAGGKYCKICKVQKNVQTDSSKALHQNAELLTTLDGASAAAQAAAIKAGYTTDASLTAKQADCTTKGADVYYCPQCDLIFEQEVQALDHKENNVSKKVVAMITFNTTAAEQALCDNEKAIVTYCELCCKDSNGNVVKYLDKVVVVEAAEHVWETKNNNRTAVCDETLYTWEQCKTCNDEKPNSKVATGTKTHNYVETSRTGFDNCTQASVINYTCTNVGCDANSKEEGAQAATKSETVAEAIKNAHDYTLNDPTCTAVLTVVPATCQDGAYQRYECTVCDWYSTQIGTASETTDAANHETIVLKRHTAGIGTSFDYVQGGTAGTDSISANEKISRIVKYPTCTENGSAEIYCDCGTLVTAVILADGHVYDDVPVYIKNGVIVAKTNGTTYWNWDASTQDWAVESTASKIYSDSSLKLITPQAIPASCKAAGQTAGTCCIRCGVWGVEPEVVELADGALGVLANHGTVNKTYETYSENERHYNRGTTPVTASAKHFDKSCLSDGYTSYYCPSCCATTSDRIQILDNDGECDPDAWHDYTDTDLAAHFNFVDATPASCQKEGNYKYVECKTCKLVLNVWTCTSGSDPDDCTTEVVDANTGYFENCTNPEHQAAHNGNNPVIAKLTHTFVDVEAHKYVETTDRTEWETAQAKKVDNFTKFELCTVKYTTDYKECTICYAKDSSYKVITPKHTMVKFTASAADCATGTKGLAQISGTTLSSDGKYCSACLGNGTTANVCVVEIAAKHTYEADYTGEKTTISHTNMAHADCTAPSITLVEECGECRKLNIPLTVADGSDIDSDPDANIVYPVNTDHNWGLDETKYTIAKEDGNGFKAGQILVNGALYTSTKWPNGAYACELSMENTVKCTRCDETKKTGTKTELADHTYINDALETVVIDTDCTAIAAHLDKACQLCKRVVAEKVPEGKTEAECLLINHTALKTDKQSATCTEAGADITLCLDCNKTLSSNVTPAKGCHEIVAYSATKVYSVVLCAKATHIHSATECYKLTCTNTDDTHTHETTCYSNIELVCTKEAHTHVAACGNIYNDVGYKYAFDITKKVEPTKAAAGVYTYFCKECKTSQEYVVAAKAGLDLDFKATNEKADLIRVDVSAVGTAVKFNKITFKLTGVDGVVVSDTRATLNNGAFVAADNVTIKQVKGDDGKSVTVTILVPANAQGKEVNSKLTANKTVLTSVYFDVLYTAGDAAAVTVSDVKISYVKEGSVDAGTQEFATTADAEYKYSTNFATFAPVVIGDINGNGEIDATDVAQTATNAYAGKYVAALDFNKDGVVDIADYVAVAVFAASEGTYADYLELIGIDYLEIVNAFDADLLKDLNGDGTINEADRTYLAKKVLATLKSVSAYDKTNMETVDQIIADNNK